jgi:hypothetical protein
MSSDYAPCIDVNDADGIVSKLSDEQPPMHHVDRQVIDAAFYIPQGNLRFQNQRRTFGC